MGSDLGHAALALIATTVYYIAFLFFRVSARRMEPLRGSRPFRVARLMLTDPVWLVGDRRAGGRHARRLAGVAYGIGAGACAGLAEAGIRGISLVYQETGSLQAVMQSAYPYLTIGLAAIALGQLQVALQRCRIAIVAVVLTVIGRMYLLLAGTVLFGEDWPRDTGPFLLRAGGFALALLALTLFPRYEEFPLYEEFPRYEDRAPKPAARDNVHAVLDPRTLPRWPSTPTGPS